MNSIRYGASVVTAGYTLWLLFTPHLTAEDFHASLKGTVTNALTGERLRKAYVRLALSSDAGHIRPAVTDENGRFTFENLPPGSYSLEAEHQGFIDGKYGDGGVDGTGVELKLAADQELSGLEIKLMPPAAISGRIKDEDGDPWTHANVSIYRSAWRRGKRQLEGFDSAEVDDKGEFRRGHLPPGRYYLSVDPDANWERTNRPGSAPHLQPTWYPGSLDSASAVPVTLLAGQEITGIEIRLRRRDVYRIRGKVSGLQAIPLLGTSPFMKPRLSLFSAGAGGIDQGAGMKEDGSFEVDGVAPGNYGIRVSEGFPQMITLGSTAVQIDDHDVEDVSLTVHAPHSLKGMIRFDDDGTVAPAGLSLWLDSPQVSGSDILATPGKDGSFVFENVPSGRYRVHVGGNATQDYVKRLRYGGIESSGAAFSFTGSDDSLELILSARAPRVSGVVKRNGADQSATPQVVLLPDTSDLELQSYGTQMGVLDQSGAFTFKEAVRPGEYTVYAFEGVPEGAWTDAEFIKAIERKGVRIKVEEGDAKTVEVPMIPRSEIAPVITRLGMD